MERIEAVDDLLHQLAHLVLIDAGDFGPWNAAPVCVHDENIRIVASPGGGGQSGVQRLQLRSAHTDHGHDLGQPRRDALFVPVTSVKLV